MAADLNQLAAFVAVAETRSFRAASERLGVTRSAVSQAVRRLETALAATLFRRTTRSVALTESGERLLASAGPALARLDAAMAELADRDSRPSGLLRIAVSSIAESFINGPLIAGFAEAFPEVQLDIFVTDEAFDIVERGFDAGVRLGEVLDQDMIAVPVSEDQRQLVVGAPGYLARAGRPVHPRDLAAHRCIGWRPAPDAAPYRWEFTEKGRDFAVQVAPQVTTNDMWVMLRTALAGGGLTFGMEETFRPYLDRGQLVPLLEAFCPPFPGFFLYYPSRRDLPARLRALIDHVREHRRRAATATG